MGSLITKIRKSCGCGEVDIVGYEVCDVCGCNDGYCHKSACHKARYYPPNHPHHPCYKKSTGYTFSRPPPYNPHARRD